MLSTGHERNKSLIGSPGGRSPRQRLPAETPGPLGRVSYLGRCVWSRTCQRSCPSGCPGPEGQQDPHLDRSLRTPWVPPTRRMRDQSSQGPRVPTVWERSPLGLGHRGRGVGRPLPHQGKAAPGGCPGLSGTTRKCPSLSGGGSLLPYPPSVKLHRRRKGCFRDQASPAKPSHASPVPSLTRPGEAALTSGWRP